MPGLGNCQEHTLSATVTLGLIGKYQNGHKAKRLLRQQKAWCLLEQFSGGAGLCQCPFVFVQMQVHPAGGGRQ